MYLKNYLVQLILGVLALIILQGYATTQVPVTPSAQVEETTELETTASESANLVASNPVASNSASLIIKSEATPSATINEIAVPVAKVVDGDTIKVLINSKTETVRIVGINTPETVDPRKPVECFGREASDKMKELVENKTVSLETDATQSDRDRYGRLLRFVFLVDGTDVGLALIEQGFAKEALYSNTPHKYHQAYLDAQKQAEEAGRGLWKVGVCGESQP